ncbi:hypothetical protein HK103_007036 [Boothiomyces macroporosus]|uniref:AB hydrolase-1 domain-containing protein n=1 Tax=Boothiomyces macroporosus TaxID=261099 RepID=A0AAD5UD23_9FUNG|nr:hypothetical protein HK103_007036 [Boothiomyces macroporosus]
MSATSKFLIAGLVAYFAYKWIVPSDTKELGSLKHASKSVKYYREDYWKESGYFDFPTGKTHYYYIGPKDGIRVVFVHGLGVPPPAMAEFLNQLAERGFRILTFETYGRGYSDSPGVVYNEDLFVDQLAMVALKSGWEKFNIIGFSLGGAITAGFVSRFPEHVEKIALVAPVGIMKENFRIVQSEHLAYNPGLLRALRSTILNFKFGGFANDFKMIEKSHQNKILGIWGSHDQSVPTELSSELQELMPSMRLVIKEGLGHEILLEDTPFSVNTIDSYFKE